MLSSPNCTRLISPCSFVHFRLPCWRKVRSSVAIPNRRFYLLMGRGARARTSNPTIPQLTTARSFSRLVVSLVRCSTSQPRLLDAHAERTRERGVSVWQTCRLERFHLSEKERKKGKNEKSPSDPSVDACKTNQLPWYILDSMPRSNAASSSL